MMMIVSSSWQSCLGILWGVVEAIFYLVFHLYLRPRANQQTVPAAYRSPYANNRRLLLERIVHRILRDAGCPHDVKTKRKDWNQRHEGEERQEEEHGGDVPQELDQQQHQVLAKFLLAWFRTTTTTTTTSITKDTTTSTATNTKELQPAPSVVSSASSSGRTTPNTSIEAATSTAIHLSSSTRRFSSSSSSASSSLGVAPSRLPSSTCYSDDDDEDEETTDEDTASDDDSREELLGGMVKAGSSSLSSPEATFSSTTTTSSSSSSLTITSLDVNPPQCISNSCIETTRDGTTTTTTTTTWRVPGMTTLQMRRFMAWAFFAADEKDLNELDRRQLEDCMDYLRYELHVSGDDETPPQYFPRRMTLEDVCPWHRPLFVYVMVQLLRSVAGFILRWMGFRHVQSASGVRGYVRVSNHHTTTTTTPLVFFHGIAPAAILLYLPMVLCGMQAPNILLIETINISCCIQYTALSEEETVDGVQELVERYFGRNANVVLAGHSFGSCPITWILNHQHHQCDLHEDDDDDDNKSNQKKQRMIIRDVLLLDPVTILLSESDVMINFLYSHEKVLDKIRMVASSELFTEYYLRRHFAWYNSELWLEDFTTTTRFFVGLAQDDEIVNAKKVHHHILNLNHPNVQVQWWENVGHGSVVMDVNKWQVLRQRLAQSNVVLEAY